MSQKIHRFENGYGASVISHGYGSESGLFELAVLGPDGIDRTTPLGDRVIGWQTKAQIADLLERIKALPRKEK